jgi:tetratricopeptide (TPR) repeat protein
VEAQPESSFQGDTEWSFHHNLLQEVTYESVLKRERATLHRVAAGWLERQARQAGRLDEFAGLLGEHCERAGELSAAADWYLQAGRRAFSQGALREAMEFYRRAIELLPPVDRERRWMALLGRLDGHAVLFEPELWKADINALLELATSFGDDAHLAEAYFQQAAFGVNWEEEPAIFDQVIQEALRAARRCGNEALEAKTLAYLAAASAARVNQPDTYQNIEEAIKLARRLGDESVLAFVLGRAGFCYGQMGDVARAYAIQSEQVELNRRLGNRAEEALGLGNMGSGFMTVGMYKQARSLIEQSRAIQEALGARFRVAFSDGNLGEICRHIGDLRRARQLLEQALLEFTPSRDPFGISFMLNELGLVLLAIGDVSGASRHFSEARQLSLSKELLSSAFEASSGLAACSVALGQLDEARTYVQETWEHLKTRGSAMMENPAKAYHTCCEVFEALGEAENTRTALESGYQALMEKADTMNVPGWRQSFLENVPDNRALVEMWERRKLEKI